MYVAQASYVGAPGFVSRLKPRGGGYIIYMNKYFIMNIYFFYFFYTLILLILISVPMPPIKSEKEVIKINRPPFIRDQSKLIIM